MTRRPLITLALAGTATIASASLATATGVSAASTVNNSAKTTSPIKHVVVLFQENVSFDHYFGTYPNATNTDGQPFTAKPGTPTVNGLTTALLTANPNGVNPQRLGAANVLTCDQNHDYTPEQQALDGGLMDKFPTYTQVESCSPPDTAPPGLVMDYYDGNTVTALWNYAQRFAMSDNNFDTDVRTVDARRAQPRVRPDPRRDTGRARRCDRQRHRSTATPIPTFDECSAGSTIAMSGTNIGNELNARHVTWGWFQGGFAPTSQVNGTVVCGCEPHQHRRRRGHRLQRAPRSVPVLREHCQPCAPSAGDRSRDRPQRTGEPSVRPELLLPEPDRRQPAGGELRQGAPLPGRPRRLLGSARRADLPCQHDQCDRAVQVLEVDSDRHHLRRLGRLVRPGDATDRQPVDVRRGCVDGNRAVRHRHAGRRVRGSLRLRTAPAAPRHLAVRARRTAVDHSITDTTSVLRFIEDNWSLPRIGGGSFDALAGSINGMFNFSDRDANPLILNPATGEPAV